MFVACGAARFWPPLGVLVESVRGRLVAGSTS